MVKKVEKTIPPDVSFESVEITSITTAEITISRLEEVIQMLKSTCGSDPRNLPTIA
jgi:hypothetical protein